MNAEFLVLGDDPKHGIGRRCQGLPSKLGVARLQGRENIRTPETCAWRCAAHSGHGASGGIKPDEAALAIWGVRHTTCAGWGGAGGSERGRAVRGTQWQTLCF